MGGTSELEPTLRVGTPSWSSESWRGMFYSADCHPGDFLAEHAHHFDTVEVDSTFYRISKAHMVDGWKRKTSEGFLFALKAPRVITHDKVLADCQEDLSAFLRVADRLGDGLGPILLQFPYFNRKAFAKAESFFGLLRPFLARLPKGYRFAVEVRNKSWVGRPLIDLLGEQGVAFALIDHPWMWRPAELLKKCDPVTAEFSYIRFLGDRRKIEDQTKSWDKLIVDRSSEMTEWIPIIEAIKKRGTKPIFLHFNNHYAGHAPGSVGEFMSAWQEYHGQPVLGTRCRPSV